MMKISMQNKANSYVSVPKAGYTKKGCNHMFYDINN